MTILNVFFAMLTLQTFTQNKLLCQIWRVILGVFAGAPVHAPEKTLTILRHY
jgi:hypothetical protein